MEINRKAIDYGSFFNFKDEICAACDECYMQCSPLQCGLAAERVRGIIEEKGCDVRIGNFLFAPVEKGGES